MSVKAWNALLVLALVIVLSGGGYILYYNYQLRQAEIQMEQERVAAEEKREAEERAAQRAALLQKFEDFLNNFLQGVYSEVQEYKTSRSVMDALLEPDNLRDADYIAENAQMADSTSMSLQLQMNDILNTFEDADVRIQELLSQLDEETQVRLQARWDNMRNENVSKLVTFFDTEQEILSAQLGLIRFYNDNRAEMSVDTENDRVLFEDVTLQEEEAMLRAKIMELEAVQKDALGQ